MEKTIKKINKNSKKISESAKAILDFIDRYKEKNLKDK